MEVRRVLLKSCVKHFRWMIVIYILIGFAIQYLEALGIKMFQQLLDTIITVEHIEEMIWFIILYGAVLIGLTILNYVDEYPNTYLSNSIVEKLKIFALTKVSKIDYASYQSIGTGEMIQVIENGAQAGGKMLHSFYLTIFHELLPKIAFSLLFIGLYNIHIMFIILAGYVLVFMMTHLLLGTLYRVKASLIADQEQMSRYTIRGFMELVVFRLNRRYQREIDRMTRTSGQIIKRSTQIRLVHEAFFAIFALFVNVIKIGVIFYGANQIIAGDLSIGIIVAMIMFIDQVYMPIAIFNVLYVDYKLDRVTYSRFEAFLNQPEDQNLDTGISISALRGRIEFDKVTYDDENHRILNEVSFTIEQGSSVAIAGMSGSGKSTIVKLMTGLLKKKSGRILIDGIDIDELHLHHLYEQLSYISQEPPIFDTTIRNNLLLPNHSDEDLYELLDKVGLQNKVRGLPKQLDTWVGERGTKLSGGEKQRLAFARIMGQQRPLVILDEPVSALDNILEKQIMREMLHMFKEKTMLVVAHRLSFIKDVDKILLVKDGAIEDAGSFEELMCRSNYFQELWNKEHQNTFQKVQ
ncbi:ABC transporter ATP-binding protein [Paenibacillus sp. FSL H7-0326]|nr:ABC transporter ATP-binding protein [Paenibacillus sp. FSL H7-0326]